MSSNAGGCGGHDHNHEHSHHHEEDPKMHSLSLAYQTYMRHDEEETNHFEDVCRAFRQHAAFAMAFWANQQYRIHSLPEEQQQVLPEALKRDTSAFLTRASKFKEAAIRNQFCVDCILRHAGVPHSQEVTAINKAASDASMSKVSSVLKSLARDWSADGKAERDMAYLPILEQVQIFLPIQEGSSPPRICVPGSGAGRLAFELTRLGYVVQGNEFSLYMLLASDFILNGAIATPERPLRVYPMLLESRNNHSSEDMIRPVQIPDVDPWAVLCPEGREPPEFSMAAGDFASIYSSPKEANQWDCVACCFFLDAVPSVVEYLQLIYRMLRPGGALINLGPLLFHWSGPPMRPDDKTISDYRDRYSKLDNRYLDSVDICYEDIRQIMINIGFEIVHETTGIKALYTTDKRSMMNTVYRCVSFVAKKPQAGDANVDRKAPDSNASVPLKDNRAMDGCLSSKVDVTP